MSFRAAGEKSSHRHVADSLNFSLRSAPFEITERVFSDSLLGVSEKRSQNEVDPQ
jgi:hypothetical protein